MLTQLVDRWAQMLTPACQQVCTPVSRRAGGLLIARYLAGCFVRHEMAVWCVALCTVGLALHAGWQHSSEASNCGATAGAQRTRPSLAARALYSLLFTLVTARTAYLTAGAELAAGGLRHVPGALLSRDVLPHTLLLALSLEVWTWQAMQDGASLIDGDEEVAASIAAAAPLRTVTLWPLEACRGLLQLAVAAVSVNGGRPTCTAGCALRFTVTSRPVGLPSAIVQLSGEPGGVVAGWPLYRLPFGVRMLHGVPYASHADVTAAIFRKASTDVHANSACLLLEFPVLSIGKSFEVVVCTKTRQGLHVVPKSWLRGTCAHGKGTAILSSSASVAFSTHCRPSLQCLL